MESMFQLFCTDKHQTVFRYISQKETEIEPDLWDGYLVKLVHKKPIHFSVVSKYANHLVRSEMLSSSVH